MAEARDKRSPAGASSSGNWDRFVAASGAAVASALITNPMDVVKTRVQTQAAQLTQAYSTVALSQQHQTRQHCTPTSPGMARKHLLAKPSSSHTTTQLGGRYPTPGRVAPPLFGIQASNLSCGCLPSSAGAKAAAGPIPGGPVCSAAGTSECGVFRGSLDAFRKIVRREGIRVLWRGTPAALAMAIPQVGIYMPTYEMLRGRLSSHRGSHGGEESFLPALVAGTTARGLAVLITSPLERYRTRAQAFAKVSGADQGRLGLGHGGHGGLGHLWKGTVATLARDVPFSGIYWVVTEATRARLSRRFLGEGAEEGETSEGGHGGGALRQVALVNLLSGTVGGVVAASLTTPLDVAKTRIQVDLVQGETQAGKPGGSSQASTTRQHGSHGIRLFSKGSGLRQVGEVLHGICTREGAGRLFDGASARAARAAPSCAIVLTSYEILKAIIAKF